ncbi:MAG: methyltransferase domain-containing protein [Flavisolibacter sp.]|nr:methyltransferase domain-containing protein [Flavisolibacter sp.]
MKEIIKYIVGKTYKPLLVKYLSRTRTYTYQNIVLEVPAEVFHPGFFSSTKLLNQQVSKLNLLNKTFLELGAGSGLISFSAIRKGAIVTSTDINPVAVQYMKINAARMGMHPVIIHSDLFSRIPLQQFDVIAVNPPYYKKHPKSFRDHAWYCGVQGEFFKGFFSGLKYYTHEKTIVYMVLNDDCDMQLIKANAELNGFSLEMMFKARNLVETNFIFKILSHANKSAEKMDRQQEGFSSLYHSLRKSERRIYSDEELALLPFVEKDHRYASEWKVRKNTAHRLKHYLMAKPGSYTLLEVGCGNGWLSHFLALNSQFQVMGLDPHGHELEQAKKVFNLSNLDFIHGSFNKDFLEQGQFDFIVFAASAQYFPSFKYLISVALKHLSEEGEIHILDSGFYNKKELPKAVKRSASYFEMQGFPEMQQYYFHHAFDDLKEFSFRFMNRLELQFARMMHQNQVFPWIRIKHQ